MQVKVEFVVETSDYGEEEFKEEIKKLIHDIDPSGETQLLSFSMKEVTK